MIASCKTCGAKFKFNEAKIQKRAIVKCPACQAKNLLEQDPNSPEPVFFVSRYEPEAKQGRSSASLDLATSPKPVSSTPNSSAQFESLGGPPAKQPASSMPASTEGSSKIGVDRIKEELNRDLEPSSGVQSIETMQRSRRRTGDIRSATHTQVSAPVFGGRSEISWTTWGLIFLAALVLAGGVYVFLPDLLLIAYPPPKAEKTEFTKGERFLAELEARQGRPAGDALQFAKQAEMQFKRDLPDGYRNAQTLFGKALILMPNNPELIARYIESGMLLPQKTKDLRYLRNLLDLIEHGFTLLPDHVALHRARGRVFLALEQRSKAQAEAEIARKLEPSNIENMELLAETLIGTDPQRAVDLLAPVITKPGYPIMVIRPLSKAYLALGELAEAELVMKLRDEIDPSACAMCQDLGRFYESIGAFEKAKESYSRLKETRPSDVAGLLGLAHVAWASGEPIRECLNILQSLPPGQVERYSQSDRVQYWAAISHYSILDEKRDQARRAAEKAFQLGPDDVDSRYQYVMTRTLQGDLAPADVEQGLRLLNAMLLDYPEQPEIWTLMGELERRNGDLKSAMEHFQRAIQADSSYRPATFILTTMYLDALNTRKAFTTLETLMGYEPDHWLNNPDVNLFTDFDYFQKDLVTRLSAVDENEIDNDYKYFIEGLVQYHFRAFEESIESFEKILKNVPMHPKANLYLAFAYLQRDKTSKARRYLANVLKKNRNDPLGNRVLCSILDKEGKSADALRRLQRLIDSYGTDANMLALMALLSTRQGELDQAKVYARMAYRLDPKSVNVRYVRYLSGS